MKFAEKYNSSASKAGAAKDVIKLQDQESVTGVIQGKPVKFKEHWKPKEFVGYCTKNEQGDYCLGCSQGLKGSPKFRVNFIVRENGAFVAKILSLGPAVWDELGEIEKAYETDINNVKIKISRSGREMNDTRYKVIATPDWKIPSEVLNQIQSVKLHDLTIQTNPKSVSDREPGEDDVPFEDDATKASSW